MAEHRNSLQPGYRLHWYLIREILGQGGFGITYLAEDTNLNRQVAIKEFLPVEMAVRADNSTVHPVSGEFGEQFQWGLERFISEARTLAQFKHPNIVRVYTVFTENNTAYMIMEYEHGRGLHEILKERRTLGQGELTELLMPVLNGLEQVHAAGFIHRDIKPPNLYLRADGSPVLLDFGSARQSLGERTRTLTTMVSPGYAPFEQYVSKSDKQGPWTDIYGLGATLYRAVTGRSPPNAVDRSEALLNTGRDLYVPAGEFCGDGYDAGFLAAIDHALAFHAEDRPQGIAAWRREFEAGTPTAQPVTTEVARAGNGADVTGSEQPTVRITMPADSETAPVTQPLEEPGRKTGFVRRWFTRAAVVAGSILLLAFIMNRLLLWMLQPEPQQDAGLPRSADKGNVTEPDTTADFSPIREEQRREPEHVDTIPVPEADAVTDRAAAAATAEPDQDSATEVRPASDRRRLISDDDRRRLAALKRRLQESPGDQRAARQVRELVGNFSRRIQEALKAGDLDLAEAYLREARTLAPDNQYLAQALERLRAMQQDRNP